MSRVTTAVLISWFLILSVGDAGAANLVGDADNSGAIEMADAALALDSLYGTIGPTQISPLALADGDADLDLADLMLIAQAVTGTATLSGPGSLLSITHPSDPSLIDGQPDFPVVFDVASNYPNATLVDGLEISVTMAPGESILSGASTLVASGTANATFTPINATAPDDAYSIDAQIVVRNSDDSATAGTAADTMTVSVSPSEICDNGVDDDGDLLVDCADPACPDSVGCLGNGQYDCSGVDTCLAGVCEDNDFSDGTPCTDNLLFCDGPETCFMGICSSYQDPWFVAHCQFCDEFWQNCNAEVCNDGIDNTGNLLVDCADPSCWDGFSCSGNGVNACSGPDTCLAGACDENDYAAGSACGDQGVECLTNDACNGSGSCIDNGFDDGAPCTSGNGASECTGPDTCLSGACMDNDLAAGSPCGDQGVECLVNDACDGAGSCLDAGFDDGAPCTTGNGAGDCSNADTCLSGACMDNDLAAGAPCGDQGFECLINDACDGLGGCVDNGFEAIGTACGDPSDTECANPDACDGSGVCQTNDEPVGAPCGDQGIDCLLNDACDGAGSCLDNGSEPDGTLCADDSQFCTGVEQCLAGVCVSPGDPCSPDFCDEANGICNGSVCGAACVTDADCTFAATGGLCPNNDPTDCIDVACVGGGGESEIGICSEQSGMVDAVCLATTCSVDSLAEGTAIGGDCTTRNDTAHIWSVTFNTQSTSGTLFSVWARILLDTHWDAGEQYDCSISGVSGVGTVNWSYTEASLTGGLNGPGCAALTADGDFCWAAANDNTQIALDLGAHTLTCVGNTNSNLEWMGFDGLIFTTDPAYIPDFQDTACDSDAMFQAGTCFGNWGPSDHNPGVGFCVDGQPGDLGDECRSQAGECDAAEVCDGINPFCPADAFDPAGALCGTFGLECAVNDTCDGAGTCVDNGFQPAGTLCGAGVGEPICNPDLCDGAGLCLDNAPAPDGTLCADDFLFCTGPEICNSGLCASQGDPCVPLWESCDEPSDLCELNCGNGALDPGESCDDGPLNGSGPGFCLADCSGVQP